MFNLPDEFTFLFLALGGFVAGKIVTKLKLPSEYGQLLFGLSIGPSGAYIFSLIIGKEFSQIVSSYSLHNLAIFSKSAVGILAFTIGSYLTRHSLHNAGKRIFQFAAAHTIVTYTFVYLSLIIIAKVPHEVALILAAISIAVSPGPVVNAVQKENARGIFTKTLLGVVAFSNLSTIILFDFTRTSLELSLSGSDNGASLFLHIFHLLYRPTLTVLWGISAGLITVKLTTHLHKKSEITAVLFFAIFFNIIFAELIGFSSLLINLTMGMVFSNKSYHTPIVLDFFANLEGILISFFFTLAGAHINILSLPAAGLAGVVFIISRIIAQWSAAFTVASVGNYSKSIGKYLGFALIPKAELAIALFVSLTNPVFEPFMPLISAVVVASVVINELIGPFAVTQSIRLSNENEQASPRLVDFLHEEFILMPLNAIDKWDAIEKMSEFLIQSNHLKHISVKELHRIVVEREKEFPTAIGENIAVPHARIPGNSKLMGVIGICSKPLDFNSFDNKLVDIVILVATPEGKSDLHIRLLATIARIFSNRPLYNSIISAESAAEVYDILQSREVRDINSYLQDN